MNELKKYLTAIITLLFVFGCSPKYDLPAALQEMDKANSTFPGPVKKWVDDRHPCFPLGAKSDSTAYLNAKRIADSIQALYEVEKSKLPEVQYLVEKDTAGCIEECNKRILQQNNSIAIRDKTIFNLKNELTRLRNSPIHDTVQDQRALNALQFEFEQLQYSLEQTREDNIVLRQALLDMESKKNRNGWQRNWLILIIVAYIGLRIVKKAASVSTPTGLIGRVVKSILKFII